uniref:C2H2-type domain-containing protein n=3 Tax=Kryptolebias marmoratus TaxID=37003 RepID=A0A3Q3G027_KRYMA
MLLAYWAKPAIQQELRRNVRNKTVYNRLSAKLATFGFNKSPQQCKEKIKKLKHSYKRIKNSQNMGCRRSVWFGILDEVLGSQPAASKCSETPKPSSAEPTQPVGSDLKTNVSTDVTEWLPDEVQVLITLWAQPNIQKQLLTSGKNNDVFTYLSNELALVGFSKTQEQCSLKVKKLEEEYKKMKQVEPHGSDGSDWFAIMDGVLGPDGETSKGVSSSAALSASKSPEDSSQAVWTSDEVGALLTLWAEDSVQERLKSTQEDERVYAQLSSQLATQGFDKTTNQCRSKIRLLEQEYGRIKEGKDSKTQKSSWFAFMDKIYGCSKLKVETKPAAEVTQSGPEFLQASLHDLPEPAEGCRLSIPSLCLLVPTLRLMCAFAWQVVQCGNVAHYQKVEELVVLVTELAPELLTARERVQLLLSLRARLVLELCRSESVANLLKIQPHLRIIQDLMMSSGCDQEELEELEEMEESKSNFVEVVHALLDDPEEKKRFFTEVFPVHYGQKYEAELQALVWKFISRLDNLLPTPDIKQTAEWLSSAPSVMEECGQLVLEQEHLKAVLHFHQKQTGNTNKCFSQAQNMFLPVLSLHPKANSRRREASLGENDGLFNCGKDKEPFEKSDALTVEESGKGNDLKDNQREGNCSSLKPFQQHHCSMCSYSDSRLSALFQHIRQEHLLLESSSFNEAKDDFLPNINAPLTVDSEFSSDILKDEVTPVSKGPPFQCDKCEKKYVCKSSLVIHYRIHTGETPFLCSVCGRGFRVSYHLKQHTSIHTGERRFRCHICGKTSVQHLSRHMRMHRGEKNYLCTECGKAFLSTAELKLHMRSHTGERPYKCKHCGKGFTAKCQLTVHTRRHTGESPYKCSLCPKSFPTLRAQKKHLKIHTDKKSLQCLKCGKIFRQKDTFKLHIETHD